MAKFYAVFLLALITGCMAQFPGQGNKYYGSICENKKGILRCPGTQTITIKFANYGRTRFFKCGMGFNTKCISETSLKIVSDLCNGKNSCVLHASDDVFGDPCSWTKKYLALYWECD
ncbi:unnamed protein product [Porites evermanni]|uniref:SUEL-type lectin domain-containing protein n=1 Tax=Porites evermanni TaxID=104178 RepID=A0ABN8LAD9_9CNID|nr:unnamed protein product [Porites evermanni]